MKKNRWTHGTQHFVVPTFPEALVGHGGCNFQRITFDELVGEEVCVVYLEDPHFVGQYNNIIPFNLIIHPGFVRTPHGLVAFIVWQIAADSPQEVTGDHYLNPYDTKTFPLLEAAANQTHFKLVILNNQNGEVGAFVDFENTFRFDQVLSELAKATNSESECDFEAAAQYVMDHMTVSELITQSIRSMYGVTADFVRIS